MSQSFLCDFRPTHQRLRRCVLKHSSPKASTSTMATTAGISTGGKVFFGSLCAGTFGLGCWQVQRLVEKVEKVEERNQELKMAPITKDWETTEHPYRRRLLQGKLRHDKEVLLGPRGAPAGVTLPRQGLSARGGGGGQSSGMSPGNQFVSGIAAQRPRIPQPWMKKRQAARVGDGLPPHHLEALAVCLPSWTSGDSTSEGSGGSSFSR